MEDAEIATNLASWFFYLSIFSAAGILAHLSVTKKSKLLAGISVALPAILGGLRYMVGIDYSSYVKLLNLLSDTSLTTYLSGSLLNKFEPTAYIFAQITAPTEGQAIIFFALSSGLIAFFYYLAARSYSSEYTGLLFFVLMMTVFPKDLSGVRQGVAVAIAFYAASLIVKKRPWAYFGLVLLAATFHYSALIMLAAYPLYWLLFTRWPYLKDRYYIFKALSLSIAGFLSVVATLKNLSIIPFFGRYAYLMSPDKLISASTPNILSKVAPIILIAPFYPRLVKNNKNNAFYLLMSILAIVFTSLGLFAGFMYRLANYFIPFYAILFINAVGITKDKRGKRTLTAAVIIYAIAHFTGSHLIRNSYGIFPYQFIF